LEEWGGEPEYINVGIVSKTICHHSPLEEASRKLYYYYNSGLFVCYSGGCQNSVFDIFELCIKVMKLQHDLEFDLNDAVRWIAQHFQLAGRETDAPTVEALDDWKILASYDRI